MKGLGDLDFNLEANKPISIAADNAFKVTVEDAGLLQFVGDQKVMEGDAGTIILLRTLAGIMTADQREEAEVELPLRTRQHRHRVRRHQSPRALGTETRFVVVERGAARAGVR